MAWAFGRALRRNARFSGCTAASVCRDASRLVVSLVDRNLARSDFFLAPIDSASRDRIFRRPPALLDGSGFRAGSVSWATPGLLFDDDVERACALDRDCL